ncbi:hypothetical protein AVEN_138577-1 [Araneus ventricosus]|uniref:Uncharacterized protein n=1 Tax=Araneus ventricosus TaxID=182803 RepID=A0A4Y2IXE1_ARAVE|nr:hypothetical protein AVEN_138577-1 [Araneus ventricosus]
MARILGRVFVFFQSRTKNLKSGLPWYFNTLSGHSSESDTEPKRSARSLFTFSLTDDSWAVFPSRKDLDYIWVSQSQLGKLSDHPLTL